MKTKTQTIRLARKDENGATENYYLRIRTQDGELMTRRLSCILKSEDEATIPKSLVGELLRSYMSKSRELKKLRAENAAMKKALQSTNVSTPKKRASWPPGDGDFVEPFG